VPLLQDLLKRRPRSYYARERLGWALLLSGRSEEAAGQFRVVLDAWPRYPNARTGLGECLAEEDRYAEARRELQEVIRLDPKDAYACWRLGSAFYQEWWEAEGLSDMSRLGHVLRRRPAALHHRELLRESAGYLRRACALDPAQADCHTNLGDVLLWDGDRTGALAEMREGVRLAPKSLMAWGVLYRGLLLSGDLDGARAALRLPLAVKPPDPYAQAALAVVLEYMGRWGEAAAEPRAAARQCPDRAYIYLAWVDAVLRAPGTPRTQDTIAELRELARQPAAAEGAHVAAGMLLLHVGKPAEAVEEFRGALHANPRSAEAHYGLGRAAQAQGDLPTAASELRQALALDAYLYAAHAALADVYSRQGNPTASKAEAALAEGESPDLLASTRTAVPR
jgi:tetratricopeptide (TPR) repeat protein